MALLEIYNDAGILQFTEEQYPFNLKAIYQIDCSTFGSPVSRGGNEGGGIVIYYQARINIGTNQAVVATRCTVPHNIASLNNNEILVRTTRAATTMYIYVFTVGPVSNSADSGFTIYDANGNITFTANDKPLKPLSTFIYCDRDSSGYGSLNGASYTGPSGRTVAYVHTKQAYVSEAEPDSDTRGYINLYRGWGATNGNTCTMSFVHTVRLRAAAQSPRNPLVNDRGIATVIDVTNY